MNLWCWYLTCFIRNVDQSLGVLFSCAVDFMTVRILNAVRSWNVSEAITRNETKTLTVIKSRHMWHLEFMVRSAVCAQEWSFIISFTICRHFITRNDDDEASAQGRDYVPINIYTRDFAPVFLTELWFNFPVFPTKATPIRLALLTWVQLLFHKCSKSDKPYKFTSPNLTYGSQFEGKVEPICPRNAWGEYVGFISDLLQW